MMEVLTHAQIATCDICDKEAFIFQEEGNFCLECWQDRTEPYITVRKDSTNVKMILFD